MNSINRYVILAEDDEDDLSLLKEAFQRKQIKEELISVRDGNELLKNLYSIEDGNKWPQFILLDLNMAGKNGRDAVRCLRTANKKAVATRL